MQLHSVVLKQSKQLKSSSWSLQEILTITLTFVFRPFKWYIIIHWHYYNNSELLLKPTRTRQRTKSYSPAWKLSKNEKKPFKPDSYLNEPSLTDKHSMRNTRPCQQDTTISYSLQKSNTKWESLMQKLFQCHLHGSRKNLGREGTALVIM